MKFKLWNRLLAALSGLILFALGACLFLFAIGFGPIRLEATVQAMTSLVLWQRVALAFGGLLLCLLGFHDMWMLFRRRGEKGFIMQHTDLGDMSISMNALETMVHKCVDQHRELNVRSTRIFRVKNGIVVEIRIILATGVNIPLTVNALQKQIKQYIASCSGVEVYEVRVLVETNVAKQGHGKEQRELVLDARKPVDDGTLPDNVVVHAADPVAESIGQPPISTAQAEQTPASEAPQAFPTEPSPEAAAAEIPADDPDMPDPEMISGAMEEPIEPAYSFADNEEKEDAEQ